MTTKEKKIKSDCCNYDITYKYGDEGTNSCICGKCWKPCNIKTKINNEWELLFDKKFPTGIADVRYLVFKNSENPNHIKHFISKLLHQQREEIIKEIEGIVGVDEKVKYGRAGAVGKTPKECELFHYGEKAGRKEIRERLKLLIK
jgi:hypothetical protein